MPVAKHWEYLILLPHPINECMHLGGLSGSLVHPRDKNYYLYRFFFVEIFIMYKSRKWRWLQISFKLSVIQSRCIIKIRRFDSQKIESTILLMFRKYLERISFHRIVCFIYSNSLETNICTLQLCMLLLAQKYRKRERKETKLNGNKMLI